MIMTGYMIAITKKFLLTTGTELNGVKEYRWSTGKYNLSASSPTREKSWWAFNDFKQNSKWAKLSLYEITMKNHTIYSSEKKMNLHLQRPNSS